MEAYKRTTYPNDHINLFLIQIVAQPITNALFCHLFSRTLKGHYRIRKGNTYLLIKHQARVLDSSRLHHKIWNALVTISDLNPRMAIYAYKMGLKPNSLLVVELGVNKVTTLHALMNRTR